MKRFILKFIFLTLASYSFVAAQKPNDDLKTYAKDYLSFSYPTNWQFADKSLKDFQQLNLTAENGNILILVFAYNPRVKTPDEFQQVKRAYIQQFIDKISGYFSPEDSSAGIPYSARYDNDSCAKISGFNISSYKQTGLYNKEPSTALIYTFALDERFISIVYFRKDKYASIGDAGWEIVAKSLNVGNRDSKKTPSLLLDYNDNEVINGRAVSLPAPRGYPSLNLKNRTLRVDVKVTIDEKGNVTSAKGISGGISFYPAAIQAARKAKFNPTYVCHQPSPSSGIIVYNFVFK